MRGRLSQRAQSDFDEIIDYLLEAAGPVVSARYGRDIQACIKRLARLPYTGAPRPALGSGLRVGRVAPYLIFYEIEADTETVHVLRILHERRNLTSALVRSDDDPDLSFGAMRRSYDDGEPAKH